MITFAAARYVGNAINEPMYDMQLLLKNMPFLEGSLHSLGLLNLQSISEVMSQPVITIYEIDRISTIVHILKSTKHNGFPVVSREGHLRGLILRKTLCSLLKYKAYSVPTGEPASDGSDGIEVAPVSTVAYDSLERTYPDFPDISSIKLSDKEMTYWLDVRIYMDSAPYVCNSKATINKAYLLFRTMGLRHMPVVDNDLNVVGIVTRADMNEHKLHEYWHHQGAAIMKSINVENKAQAIVHETKGSTSRRRGYSVAPDFSRVRTSSVDSVYTIESDYEVDPDLLANIRPDSPALPLQKVVI
jgi:chloride channel 7